MTNVNAEELKIILEESKAQNNTNIKNYNVSSGTFTGTNMKNYVFDCCIFSNVKFKRCNTGASTFTACIFTDCEFDGCFVQESSFSKCTFLFTVFVKNLMAKSEFNNTYFSNSKIVSCHMVDTKYIRCHFIGLMNFVNTNLTNALFENCTKFESERNNCELFGANVTIKNLKIRGCNFNIYVQVDERLIECIKRLKGGEFNET